MESFFETMSSGIANYITFVLRFVTPLLSGLILYRCGKSLLSGRGESETWGYLCMPNGGRIYLNHWENIIGRNRSCDALMEFPTISRIHGALIRDSRGGWKVYALNSKSGILVNGNKVERSAPVKSGDILTMGGVPLTFMDLNEEQLARQAEVRTKPGGEVKPGITLMLLTEL